MMRRSLKWFTPILSLSLLVGLAACPPPDDGEDDGVTKAAWVYIGPPGDIGWTFAHNEGRLAAELAVTDLETTFVENVPETDAEDSIQALVDAGNDVIFTTSFGYGPSTLAVAERHPEVTFEHCSGAQTRDNLAVYFGRMYQARYLTGVAAGHMSTTGRVGIVAAHPIPEVIRHINAIALGVRAANPDAIIDVRWAHEWYAPDATPGLTDELVDAGADVIFMDTDDTGAITQAAARGVYAVGYNSDALAFAPSAVLTSAVWNWGSYYAERVQAVKDGTWETHAYWGGLGDGIIDLGSWGETVPQAVKDEVNSLRAEFVAGTRDVFDGPLLKQDGSTWVPEGETLSDPDLLGMVDLVEGVLGEVPFEDCVICG